MIIHTEVLNSATVYVTFLFLNLWSRDSSVGIATMLQAGHLEERGSTSDTVKRFTSRSKRQDGLPASTNLRGNFPEGKSHGA